MAKKFKLIKQGLSQTPEEAADGVPVKDAQYHPGDARRYESLNDMVMASKNFRYPAIIDGATYNITSALAVDGPLIMRGLGCTNACDAGSVIQTSGDISAIIVSGNSQRCRFADFGILHTAATTKPAIHIANGPFAQLSNLVLNMDGTGFGGVLLGDPTADTQAELEAANANAWQCTMDNIRGDEYTDYGVKVNSRGSTFYFGNSSFRSEVDGAHALVVHTQGVWAYGGQWGANNTGGRNLYWYNHLGGESNGGGAFDMRFENVDAGEYAIDIDGNTHAWVDLIFGRMAFNCNANQGTLIRFGLARQCVLDMPITDIPGGGGILAEWTEDSIDCRVVCSYDPATVPVTVHASAVGALKVVVGRVRRSDVTNITTAANLTVILQDGVEGDSGEDVLPVDFTPTHNGVAWNYQLLQIANEGAASFTPPTARGILIIESSGEVSTFGMVAYDTDAGGADTELLTAGADLEVATGALTGTDGNAGKVTVSAHTDGDLYIENQMGGTRNYTIRLLSAEYGV